MTRDEILNLKPGVKMDVLVAEKVMEWRIRPDLPHGWQMCAEDEGRYVWSGYLVEELPLEEDEYGNMIPHWFTQFCNKLWIPSTDISCAFQVAEKMEEKGWKLGIKPYIMSGYSIFFRRESHLVSSTCAKLSELPEAICKAALEAVGANPIQ